MATVRIYKVAELLGTTSQEVLSLLKRDHGIELKSASSTIEEVVARSFVERVARQRNISLPGGDMFAEHPAPAKGGKSRRRQRSGTAKADGPVLGPPRLVKVVKFAARRHRRQKPNRPRTRSRSLWPRLQPIGAPRAGAAGTTSGCRRGGRPGPVAQRNGNRGAAAGCTAGDRRTAPAPELAAARTACADTTAVGCGPLRAADDPAAHRGTGKDAAAGAAAGAGQSARRSRSRASSSRPPRSRRQPRVRRHQAPASPARASRHRTASRLPATAASDDAGNGRTAPLPAQPDRTQGSRHGQACPARHPVCGRRSVSARRWASSGLASGRRRRGASARRPRRCPPRRRLRRRLRTITLAEGMTVKDLADKLDVRVKDVSPSC